MRPRRFRRPRALIALSLGILGVVALAPTIAAALSLCLGWAIFGASAVLLGLGLFAELEE
jgi:hypothetical protein